MLIKTKKAQSTLEYALLVALVVGVTLSMQNYLKRGLQGKFHTIGNQFGEQYSPGETEILNESVATNDKVVEITTQGVNGKSESIVTGGHQESTTSKKLGSLEDETWANE